MASIKLILREDKIKNGKAPLYLRVIKDRKTRFISLGTQISPLEWNVQTGKVKKSHPNSTRMNAFLSKKISDAESHMLELESGNGSSTSFTIKERLKGKVVPDFFELGGKYRDRIKVTGSYGMYKRVKTVLDKLEKFVGHRSLACADINVTFLKKYDLYLSSEKIRNCKNTIHANLRVIKTILNSAVQEDIITPDQNPFSKYTLKTEKTSRAYLTEEELGKLKELKLLPGSFMDLHRDMYVFAAECGGIRISDLLTLTWSNYDGEKLNLRIRKTKTALSIKVPECARAILSKYSVDPQPDKYISPSLKVLPPGDC